MSYWSHNPEQYEEIMKEGILRYLKSRKVNEALDETEALEYLEELQCSTLGQRIFDVLASVAFQEILDAEGSYWSRLADYAETVKDAAFER